MSDEFRRKNLKEWEHLLNKIFDKGIPDRCTWNKRGNIISILKLIGRDHNVNHTFLPTGGGLDLAGAGASAEPGCIELHFSERSADIVKPKSLIFQSFGNIYEWAYFRLETETLEPSGVYEGLSGAREELTEIAPGEYVDRCHWDDGYYGYDENGNDALLPKTARVVVRYFSGSFVIFAKGSTYNAVSSTYDGRHSKMSDDEFKQYIGNAVGEIVKKAKL